MNAGAAPRSPVVVRAIARPLRASVLAMLAATWLAASPSSAEPVPVRYLEGVTHGFLVLRSLDGASVADGDLIQTAKGNRVTTRLVFRFPDGSLHDETAVFSQQRQFRLISYHLVQKGPTFPRETDMLVDVARGQVTVRYTDQKKNGDGKPEEKLETERLTLPLDLSNGLMLTMLKNIKPDRSPKELSFVASTPKPRLVKLVVTSTGTERLRTGRLNREATHYVVKVEIGGLTGLLASVFGKQPPDSHVWIVDGDAPAFVRSEQTLYVGGPVWRIELVNPVWPPS
jgi:hypothetical protein